MKISDKALPGRLAAVLLIGAYMAAAGLPAIGASLYGEPGQTVLIQLGRNSALLGFMIIILQVFLAARIKWIERPFGLDIVLRFHRNMGIFALFLFIAHPFLLAAGSGSRVLILGIDVPWYIWLGRITLAILLINIFLSTYQGALNLKFEIWRAVHDVLSPLIIALAFIHSFAVGSDLGLAGMRILWIILLITAVLLFAYHRIIRPHILKRHPYEVVEVIPEAKDVWTIKLSPPQGKEIYEYLPGQFHFITFYRGRNLPVEEHHWTISSSPSKKEFVSSTIKALGDFTSTVGETRVGDKAAVHGAFGHFSYLFYPGERDLVFIAGGIGITPLMSMIRHMQDMRDDRNVLLFYANQREDQIVFRDELLKIGNGGYPRLHVVHVVSKPDKGWAGETGYVSQDKIIKYCGTDLGGKSFYLCGPPGMIMAVGSALTEMGVSGERIRTEIFSFLD